jgi:transcriptional regulator with XRE-family HTH domain
METVSVLHKKLGNKIKELRKLRNFTQEDLADKVQVDRSYMGFVERGEKNPTLLTLIKIAKAFKIPLAELFKDVE